MERVLNAPFKYLRLRDDNGGLLFFHDFIFSIITILVLTVPFLLFGDASYFAKDGFLDKIAAFCSVLTGFYVAGLVAVATFPIQKSGLDSEIIVGKIKWMTDEGWEYLSRREYVCALFGYLAAISLLITFTSIIIVTVRQSIIVPENINININNVVIEKFYIKIFVIFLCNIPISHLISSTVRGLYYLMDRIYVQTPQILPKKDLD